MRGKKIRVEFELTEEQHKVWAEVFNIALDGLLRDKAIGRGVTFKDVNNLRYEIAMQKIANEQDERWRGQ